MLLGLLRATLLSMAVLSVSSCEPSAPPAKQAVASVDDNNNNKLFFADIKDARVLVFTKTKGWHHDSIPAGVAALKKIATDNFFSVTVTDDAASFTDVGLSKFNAIVFLNTTLDVLDDNEQIAMERFIQAGGGFVGIHSAADTEWEGDWFWYRRLVGGVFKSHPNSPSNVQMARVDIQDASHLATANLPQSIEVADEWYNYRDFYQFNKVLMTVDEKTYVGGEQGAYHPITWYHDFDGGRSFYTGLGHTAEIYANPQFLSLLLGGLRYAVGGKPLLDYKKSRPENNRFVKKSIVDNLNEPVNLSFLPNGDALIAERGGVLKLVDYKTSELREVGKIEVSYQNFLEMGLLGVAVDPSFDRNHFIYAVFNVEKDNGDLFERLARFKWVDGKIDEKSQSLVLEYPVNRNCCHTGGDLQFGKDGDLFMSTGDNTNPHDQNGYAPIDFRTDTAKNDALRGAGNTQDLRGKVLRIRPLAAGGYDIPKGNLFADPKEGRPEIYVMGARNPYKITYDKATAALFYGDVGPDAGAESAQQGPRGYDEVNRVTHAGNFGWPLFIGNNYPYMDYDFVAQKSEKLFNPLAPMNNSPRNTGLKQLPPAQRPLLWYPYGLSDDFPELGKGGRAALVADVYHADDYPASEHRYPSYYNNTLFISDFMRGWIKAVSYDEFGRIIKIDPFAPNINYVLPIDARFAPDGTLYVLEYGMAWFKGNADSRLTRVEYVGAGNRPPLPKISLEKTQSAAPFTTTASAAQSIDLDGDKLTFTWSLKSKNAKGEAVSLGSAEQATLNIPEVGEYILSLTAKDVSGASASVEQVLQVGNEPATIDVAIQGNQTFYWPSTKAIGYSTKINDKEDGDIKADLTNVVIAFGAEKNEAGAGAQGHQVADAATVAQELMRANGCKSCHNVDVKVVGPAFKDVAARYKNDKNAIHYLVNKIGKGGNGAWGEMNMPSFATLSEADRTALATYVLSLGEVKKSLPLNGNLSLTPNANQQKQFASNDEPTEFAKEKFEFNVAYTDKGANGINPITVKKSVLFIPARFLMEPLWNAATSSQFIEQSKFSKRDTLKVPALSNWLTLYLGKYDLTGIDALRVGAWITKDNATWEYELRLGSDTGTVLATGFGIAKTLDSYSRTLLKLNPQTGEQDIYLAIRSKEKNASELQLYDVSFHQN